MLAKDLFFERLWAEVESKGDFPLLRASMDSLTSTLNTETSVSVLTSSILSDFSLAQKVIRLANSGMYASFGGNISTVSRAIMVLGVDAIAHLIMGIQLLDNFSGSAVKYPHAQLELTRAKLVGEISRSLGAFQGIPQVEEAVVCSLMRQLSRMLIVFYFPEQWSEIVKISKALKLSESAVCQKILGVSLEEIGVQAALKWNLPPTIAATLHEPTVARTSKPLEGHVEWLNTMADTASTGADLLLEGELEQFERYLIRQSRVIGIQRIAVERAVQQCSTFMKSLNCDQAIKEAAPMLGKPESSLGKLMSEYGELVKAVPGKPVAALVPLILESLMHSYNFRNCFIMLLNPSTKRYTARLGLGPMAGEHLDRLSFEEGFIPDFFHFALTSPKPLFLEDIQKVEVARRVPLWFRGRFKDTHSVLLHQVRVNNRCIALICGEWGPHVCTKGVSAEELQVTAQIVGELEAGFQRLASIEPLPAKMCE